MNIIPKLTEKCARKDCEIVSHGASSTLMGWTPTYDRHGNRTDTGDPNIMTQAFKCIACGASWVATTQYGKTKIAPRDLAATT